MVYGLVKGNGNDVPDFGTMELWTAGLLHPEVREIAEAYMERCGHWVDETCVNELIDNVINKCLRFGNLPWGWYGVVEYNVY